MALIHLIYDNYNYIFNFFFQVGLFRKPGVRSRIQKLREVLDSGETVDYGSYGAYDVADVVKTFFRDLPEVLLTNKISEILLTIFQCKNFLGYFLSFQFFWTFSKFLIFFLHFLSFYLFFFFLTFSKFLFLLLIFEVFFFFF